MHECFGGSTKYDQSRSKIILHRFRYAGKRAAGAAPVGSPEELPGPRGQRLKTAGLWSWLPDFHTSPGGVGGGGAAIRGGAVA